MATSTFRNKNEVRPKKSGAAKRRTCLVQRRRLIALGVDPETVASLQSNEVRELLKTPVKTAAKYAAAKEA